MCVVILDLQTGEAWLDVARGVDVERGKIRYRPGEGITGTVAMTRQALLTPDAREVSFSVTIPGTDDDLLESMLAVDERDCRAIIGACRRHRVKRSTPGSSSG